jgi:hypothetical protein
MRMVFQLLDYLSKLTGAGRVLSAADKPNQLLQLEESPSGNFNGDKIGGKWRHARKTPGTAAGGNSPNPPDFIGDTTDDARVFTKSDYTPTVTMLHGFRQCSSPAACDIPIVDL